MTSLLVEVATASYKVVVGDMSHVADLSAVADLLDFCLCAFQL